MFKLLRNFLAPALLLFIGFIAVFTDPISANKYIASADKTNKKRVAGSTLAPSAPAAPSATPILVDDFDYVAGTLLTANGWSNHSGTSNFIPVVSPGLSFSGYPGSGVGNAASLTTTGEDVNKTFTSVTSGSVYSALMVKVSAADLTAGYFFHFCVNPMNTTDFRGRVNIKRDSSNAIAFGIAKATTTDSSIVYTPFSYSLNTTYLLVLKYTVVDGTSNDTVSLTVLSTTAPSTEPSATVTATDAATDINPGSVALRQGSTGSFPTLVVDGVRVGTSWESVTQTSTVTQKPILDFNGDGKTDYVVTRDSAGSKIWYTAQNGSSTVSGALWGLSASDAEVPADYDGDGKADIAVWRQSAMGEGTFYILRSSDSTVQTEPFGQNGDDPSVTADYDGDGKADPAVFRCPISTAGQCYFFYRGSLNNTSRNITFVPWGYGIAQTTILPVSGDFDGDGKYDFCVGIDGGGGNGLFVLLKSSNLGVEYVPWGLATDQVIPRMDYDGDGKTDFAVARMVGSAYYIYILTRTGGGTGASPIQWGADGDNAAFGDYDGDGKTDIGIWRPSNGTYYIRTSSNGSLLTYGWGLNGDRVVGEWIFPRQP